VSSKIPWDFNHIFAAQDNLHHKGIRDPKIFNGRNSVASKDSIGWNNPMPTVSKRDL
jgi:hypothetical protein